MSRCEDWVGLEAPGLVVPCGAYRLHPHSVIGLACTLPQGHKGPHHAHTFTACLCVWPQASACPHWEAAEKEHVCTK